VENEASDLLAQLSDEVSARRLDPYAAADKLIASL
jgi:hypothetical protein